MHIARTALPLILALATGAGFANEAKDKPKAGAKPADKKAATSAPAEKGRDWTLIDTNKDGLISPDEMEAWLKANPGPQK